MPYEVVDGIYRLGTPLVNWWIVDDGGRFTVIDAGTNDQYEQLPAVMARLGKTLAYVEAVVLTHAHRGHIGSAARIHNNSGAAVFIHHNDLALATGAARRRSERRWIGDLRHGFAWRSLMTMVPSGVLGAPRLTALNEFADGDTIDVPGHPVVVHTPGHTAGSCCLALPYRRALFTGDALVTLSIVTGERTPRIMPGSANENSQEALESLNELKGRNVQWILPGHGEPWHGPIDAAVDVAHHIGAN